MVDAFIGRKLHGSLSSLERNLTYEVQEIEKQY